MLQLWADRVYQIILQVEILVQVLNRCLGEKIQKKFDKDGILASTGNKNEYIRTSSRTIF